MATLQPVWIRKHLIRIIKPNPTRIEIIFFTITEGRLSPQNNQRAPGMDTKKLDVQSIYRPTFDI